MADIKMTIVEDELSDGSKVYSLALYQRGTGRRISLDAVTYDDAYGLAEKLIGAIKAHTNYEADWI